MAAMLLLAGGVCTPALAGAVAADLVGTWQGTLTVPGGPKLRLAVKVRQEAGGALAATVVSIDQGGIEIPVKRVTFTGGRLALELPNLRARFEGAHRVEGGGAVIAGDWTQGGASLPLTLRRGGALPAARRPQVPRKPYPYREEEVAYRSRPGVKLAATLTLPPGRGPFPAVLLITGSGTQDRDETIFGHKPFLVLADSLTRRGIATLRADDPGAGGSTGGSATATTMDFVEDALAGVAYLKTRPEIDRRRLGLIGHSEGGLVAPLAAVRSADVAFIVLLAGTGVTGEKVLYGQGRRLAELGGAPPAVVAKERKLQEALYAVLKREKDDARAAKALRAAWAAAGRTMSADEQQVGLKQLLSPWFRFFLTFDPRPVLAKVRCPVLALNGEKDSQVLPGDNLPVITAALRAGGNRDVTAQVLPRLNHLFQTCTTGAVTEYGQLEETFAPAALEVIGDWVVQHTVR
jgi:pimeloyl-ACP methyl ester carboxylesterase